MTTTGESIACHACGSLLASGSPFCGACGSPVRSSAALGSGVSFRAPAAVHVAARIDAPGSGWGAIPTGPLAGRIPARPGRRVAAFLIDGVCASLVVAVANAVFYGQLNSAIVSGSSGAVAGSTKAALFGPLIVWLLGGVLMLMTEGATGATIGNAAVRIRTVSVTTGRPAGFGRALGRRFIEMLGSLVLFGAPVIAASSTWDPTPLRQGWQDKVAGTTMVGVGPRAVLSGSAEMAASAGRTPPDSQQSIPDWHQDLAMPRQSVAPQVGPQSAPPITPPVVAPRPTIWPVSPALAGAASASVQPQTRTAGGLIANVPGFEPEVEVVAPTSTPWPATPAQAPVAVDELDEELDHTRMSPSRARHMGSHQLVFDTGEIVIVDGIGLVGRNPAPRAGERVEHLIPIIDPARSVSKTHLVFGAGPDGFWVSDRDSTNGTRTVSDSGVITEAPHDVKVNVPVGGTVEFGERRFTVTQL
jgi:uncharacterized RDD family membrane protein YckC